MSSATKRALESLDARITALERVNDGSSNFLILKRDIQARLTDVVDEVATLRAMIEAIINPPLTVTEESEPPLTEESEPTLTEESVTNQQLIERIDTLEAALKTFDAANRSLWKKLLYGVQRQT